MDKITIIDNFLSIEDLNQINSFIKTNTFRSRCVSRKNQDRKGDYSYWIIDIKSIQFFNNNIKTLIEKKLNRSFYLQNSSILCNFFGQDATYHKDSKNNDSLNYTFCLYFNEVFDDKIENVDGSLYIKIPETKTIMNIDPVLNRGVFFPAHYIHKGMSFNRFCELNRYCITWKLIEII